MSLQKCRGLRRTRYILEISRKWSNLYIAGISEVGCTKQYEEPIWSLRQFINYNTMSLWVTQWWRTHYIYKRLNYALHTYWSRDCTYIDNRSHMYSPSPLYIHIRNQDQRVLVALSNGRLLDKDLRRHTLLTRIDISTLFTVNACDFV